MKAILIAIWIIVILILGLFSTTLTINSLSHKYLESRIRILFYLLAVIFSFLIGIFISN